MSDELVKRLLVEIDGNVEKLRRALRSGETDVKKFAGEAKKSSAVATAGADAVANRQANAARAIAGATETMMRQGKMGGEAMKQLIAQGSNAAMVWGPQGAVVGAIGISTLAIVGMFTRVRREAEETAKKTREEFAKMSSMDMLAAARRLREINEGDLMLRDDLRDPARREGARARFRDDPTSIGISGLQEEARRLEAERILIGEERKRFMQMSTFEQNAHNLRRLQVRKDVELVEQTLALLGPQGEFAGRVLARRTGEFGAQTRDAFGLKKPDGKAAARELAAVEAEAEAFAERFAAFVLKTVGTSVDQIAATFDALIMQATELEGKDFTTDYAAKIGQLVAMREEAIRVATLLGSVDQHLSAIELNLASGGVPTVNTFTDLAQDAALLFSELLKLHPESKEYLETQKQLLEVEKKRRDLTAGVADSGSSKGSGLDKRDLADTARELQQAADGALQLAQNLGGADANAIGLLRTVGQIAGNLPALAKVVGDKKPGTDVIGVIGAALPILGALSSLIGPSPEMKQQRAELEENTKALRELTGKVGHMGLGLTGRAAGGAVNWLGSFLDTPGANNPFAGARRAAKEFGLPMAELDKIAESFGITLNDDIRSFHQLNEALGRTITKLGEFDTTLDSQLAQAEAEIAIKGITDPAEQARIRRAAYGGRSPALDEVTAGLDLDTAKGREEARRRAIALFETMKAGGGTVTQGGLDGLNGDELLQALLDLIAGLDAVDESLGETVDKEKGSSTGTVAGFRGLTEAAGSRLEDRMRSLDVKASESQRTRLAMLDALQALAGSPFPVPSIDGSTFARGGAGVVINLNLTMPVQIYGNADPGMVTAAVRAGVSRAGDEFYRSVRAAMKVRGDVSIDQG